MKKLGIVFLSVLFLACFTTSVSAEDFEGNENTYIDMCSGDVASENEDVCIAFQEYMVDKSSELAEKKAEIESEMEEISKNIQAEVEKIAGYEDSIASMQVEIDELQTQIDELNAKIDELKETIATNEAEVAELEDKVKERMVASQATMRLNVMIDFLMGANSFEDFIRRANGISAISDYEEEVREELADLIATLADQKAELEDDELTLEASQTEMIDQQNNIIALQYKAELIRNEYLSQYADLEESGNLIAGDLEELQAMQEELAISLGNVVTSSGFINPVPGATISAGTWHYPDSFGGGIHLGVDYAAPLGTDVLAPANGVIVSSADGCPYGYYGSLCGNSGGVARGGNQIFMVCSVNGKTYGLRFFHFLLGTPIATGTVVEQGDKIAEIGSSGNSTGPHTHVEVIYLGTMSVADYVASWNGNLAFNASYGSDAYYNHLCENGASAPCRIRPESVFE